MTASEMLRSARSTVDRTSDRPATPEGTDDVAASASDSGAPKRRRRRRRSQKPPPENTQPAPTFSTAPTLATVLRLPALAEAIRRRPVFAGALAAALLTAGIGGGIAWSRRQSPQLDHSGFQQSLAENGITIAPEAEGPAASTPVRSNAAGLSNASETAATSAAPIALVSDEGLRSALYQDQDAAETSEAEPVWLLGTIESVSHEDTADIAGASKTKRTPQR